jgi:hypothetical protein
LLFAGFLSKLPAHDQLLAEKEVSVKFRIRVRLKMTVD